MSTVVEPWMVTLGGVGFMQVYDAAERQTWTVDYLGRVPKAARPDMFPYTNAVGNAMSTYEVPDDQNVKGYLAIAVPGLVAGLCEAHRRWGKLPLQAVVEPAADRAAEGIRAESNLLWHVFYDAANLRKFPASAEVFYPDGAPPVEGSLVRQPEFAATLRKIAKEGPSAFYAGEVAEAIEADMKRNGGLITREDLAAFEVTVSPSLRVPYRDVDIMVGSCPNGFWTGMQTFNILENFSPGKADHGTAAQIHTYIEAARHALADRYHYMTDPDFEPVPLQGLLSKPYAKTLAGLIDPDRAGFAEGGQVPAIQFALEALHNPGPWDFDYSGQQRKDWSLPYLEPAATHTTSFATVDRERNMVVCTQTTGETFGSSVITKGPGVMWNDMMVLFSPRPGTANSIAPGKRTLTSTSPVIVIMDGRPWFAAGAPGGRRIMNSVQQVVANVIDFGMTIQPAISAPRVDVSGEVTQYDTRIDPAVVERLEAMGHRMAGVDETNNPFGYEFAQPTGVMIDNDGNFRAGVDPFRLAEARGL
jgi:gamma-glutamyltranspeptidase/glutathione hydrolase